MNNPVSFKIAKLLKEKGLKLNFCKEVYYENPNIEKEFIRIEMIHDWELIEDKEWYSAPTIAEVIMWLYEKHGIWVHATMVFKEFSPYIQCDWNYRQDNIKDVLEFMKQMYNSPTEAYSSAIEYVLNKII